MNRMFILLISSILLIDYQLLSEEKTNATKNKEADSTQKAPEKVTSDTKESKSNSDSQQTNVNENPDSNKQEILGIDLFSEEEKAIKEAIKKLDQSGKFELSKKPKLSNELTEGRDNQLEKPEKNEESTIKTDKQEVKKEEEFLTEDSPKTFTQNNYKFNENDAKSDAKKQLDDYFFERKFFENLKKSGSLGSFYNSEGKCPNKFIENFFINFDNINFYEALTQYKNALGDLEGEFSEEQLYNYIGLYFKNGLLEESSFLVNNFIQQTELRTFSNELINLLQGNYNYKFTLIPQLEGCGDIYDFLSGIIALAKKNNQKEALLFKNRYLFSLINPNLAELLFVPVAIYYIEFNEKDKAKLISDFLNYDVNNASSTLLYYIYKINQDNKINSTLNLIEQTLINRKDYYASLYLVERLEKMNQEKGKYNFSKMKDILENHLYNMRYTDLHVRIIDLLSDIYLQSKQYIDSLNFLLQMHEVSVNDNYVNIEYLARDIIDKIYDKPNITLEELNAIFKYSPILGDQITDYNLLIKVAKRFLEQKIPHASINILNKIQYKTYELDELKLNTYLELGEYESLYKSLQTQELPIEMFIKILAANNKYDEIIDKLEQNGNFESMKLAAEISYDFKQFENARKYYEILFMYNKDDLDKKEETAFYGYRLAESVYMSKNQYLSNNVYNALLANSGQYESQVQNFLRNIKYKDLNSDMKYTLINDEINNIQNGING